MSLMIISLILLIATLAAAVWAVKANYMQVKEIANADQSAVIAQFEENGVEYQLTPEGKIFVKEDEFGKSQLLIEQQKNEKYPSKGLELFDNTDYSMTDHAQKVTMKRAIQGELERTLTALSFTKFARVHLTLVEKKLFSQNSAAAKASVTIFTHNQQILSQDQILGVQNLVAASVEGLAVDNVRVFDEKGINISGASAQENSVQLLSDHKSQREQFLTAKVEKLLNLYFEPDQYAVSISLQIDHNEKTAVINEIISNNNGQGAIVKKRSAINQTGSLEKNNKNKSGNETVEIQYNHGSKTEETKVMAGDIKSISVAVALIADINEQDLTKVKSIVAAAIGIDKNRGDTVSVENFLPKKPTHIMTVEQEPVVTAPVLKPAVKQTENFNLWWLSGLCFVLVLTCMVLLFKRTNTHQARKRKCTY